jgi:aromatic-amino-acid transaminase
MSLFSSVEMAPRDPILGLNEQFAADPNPNKVNLGVGVYYDENGKLPLLKCVAAAEQQLVEAAKPRGYLPIDGIAAYDQAVQGLVFGADSAVVRDKRVATVQALGGTGGLKVGADFLRQLRPQARVLISAPSWENHRALFTRAGFEVGEYPYYSAALRDAGGIDFAGMKAALQAAPAGTVVVLHACCHNPTGYDLTPEQWDEVVALVQVRAIWCPSWTWPTRASAPGMAEDGAAVGPFHRVGHGLLRVHFVLEELLALRRARRRAEQWCAPAPTRRPACCRSSRSRSAPTTNPPDPRRPDRRHRAERRPRCAPSGKTSSPACARASRPCARSWSPGLKAAGVKQDMSFITDQIGMFSYSGLSRPDGAPAQRVRRLRHRFRPHVRGGAEQQERGVCVRVHRQGDLNA